MEPTTFEIYAPVRNTINKALGVVVKVAGENITVQPLAGERMTFKSQYLAPATEAETAALRDLVTRLKLEEENRERAKTVKTDPALIREEFEKFVKHIAVRYPKSAEAFREFWAELMAAAGDAPGQTWEMRPNTAKNPGPVLKIFNKATQKWVYCLSLLAGWGLRLEMKKEFLPAGSEALFPIDHAMFGAGRAVELVYRDFTPEKRKPYADCVREIYVRYGLSANAAPSAPPALDNPPV
ncbi:MAG TPA: hypothetical protein DCW72_02765 [Elusimicrobia bacterium]|nr:MAG: hypothetical protein A2X29_06140 [Elusimicrobia bacterium GWA2_64_40]OGR64090.1 MAG: hypothetical protein A2X30_12490 [Elusimicrobia bacterium GWB2_63_16]HAN05800.1 hypothetical protein [Elusimicrobiota bacterium]HAU89175.1 hypothetical protein [Elusimicrobiota bacterium]